MRLFNLMKGLFSKPAEESAPVAEEYQAPAPTTPLAARPPAVMPPARVKPPVAVTPEPAAPVAQPIRVHVAKPAAASAPAPAPALSTTTGELQLPLANLINALPVELQARVVNEQIAAATIRLPLARVLPQLTQGSVRVTFGEIRQSAPEAFTEGEDADATEVALPLQELISRIAPNLIQRRTQKRVDVPRDITSPFGVNGLGLSVTESPAPAKPNTTSPRGVAPASPVPPTAEVHARGNVNPLPKPAAPTLPSRGLTPAAPPTVSNNGTAVFRRADAPTTPVAKPTNGGNGHAAPAPSAPIAMPAAKTLLVSLARIADNWPDAVKAELAQFNLTEANTALPANEIEAGLKRGKVTFSWKFIRSNITPNAPANLSPNDDVQLDLPLAIITPLFFNLGKNGGASAQKRVAVDEKIPNLFFGFPKPEPAPAAPAAPAFTPPPAPAPVPAAAAPVAPAPQPSVEPADTNYFIWDDEKESGRVDGPATPTGPSPGTNFLSRKATPNEVVQRAVVLEGVYGAMVALPDGLLVAAKLDASLSGDTVAALIPQMYSKLSGCTKELRMGELNNLHFTVGNVPWKIFRVNGLFFAAYGAAGQALPSAELARLASDLDYRKAK